MMLKLKLQYFGHLMWRVNSLEKILMLGGIGGRRRRGRQRMRWLDGIADSMDVSLSELRSWWWTGRPGVLRFMGSQRVGHDWATELNLTDLTLHCFPPETFNKAKSFVRSCEKCSFSVCYTTIPWSRKCLPTPLFLPGESPWREEPDGLQSIGLQRVGHN